LLTANTFVKLLQNPLLALVQDRLIARLTRLTGRLMRLWVTQTAMRLVKWYPPLLVMM
jgi:hypothetical protein